MVILLGEVTRLKELVKDSGKHIYAQTLKDGLSSLYKDEWVPLSQDFRTKHGDRVYKSVEDNLRKLSEYARRRDVPKKSVLPILKELETALEEIEIEEIRSSGSSVKPDIRDEMLALLDSKSFGRTVEYIREAEKEFAETKFKESCIHARLAIEELFRRARETKSGASVSRGMLPNHIDYFKQLGLISDAEEKLIRFGFYGFLSEKGNHATTEAVSREDAQLSINILYSLVQYCLSKFSV